MLDWKQETSAASKGHEHKHGQFPECAHKHPCGAEGPNMARGGAQSQGVSRPQLQCTREPEILYVLWPHWSIASIAQFAFVLSTWPPMICQLWPHLWSLLRQLLISDS